MLDVENPENDSVDEKPEYQAPEPRKGKGAMNATERQGYVEGAIQAAVQFIDTELGPDREKATDYYRGRPLGNEEQGRSQVVMTEVRDAVHGVLPSMLRVVHGSERVVEFTPTNPQNIELARQQSDYVEHIYTTKNNGFKLTQAVLKDGLIRKIGIYKWMWDDTSTEKPFALFNRTHEDLVALASEDGINLTHIAPAPNGQVPEPDGQPQEVPMFDCQGTRHYESGCPRVFAIPPEEFIFTRDTRAIGDGLLIGQRTRKTRGELIGMGVDVEKLEENVGDSNSLALNAEVIARQPNETMIDAPEAGEANDRILYCEVYMYLDEDGDGVAELRRICTVGDAYIVVDDELAEEIPFSVWTPITEPHTLVGQSEADLVMDLQRITSMVARSTLDSLAASIYPRTWYREGDANLKDVLNTEIGAPIRTKSGVNAVGTFAHPFVGKESLPILAWLDEKRERRTGTSSNNGGLDLDALQSTTKSGVDAAVSQSMLQVELLVRNFVEDAFKPMFRGLNRLIVSHNPRQEMVRLRGQFVEVNPAAWDADADVTVNVALGAGLTERKLATLGAIVAKQEMILQLLGPSNPLVTLNQYSKALNRAAELEGYAPGEFFNIVDPNWAPQPQGDDKPSPEEILAQAQLQIEQMKVQRELTIKDAELKLKREEAIANQTRHEQMMDMKHLELQMQDDRERDKAASDGRIKMAEIEAVNGVKLNIASIEADIERERLTTQADLDTRKMHLEAETTQHKTNTDAQAKVDSSKATAEATPAKPAPAPKPGPAPVIHVHVGGKKKSVNKNAAGGYDITESE